ncbi:hypothetical protein A5844_000490 [Enterococcus sp. 10A9_DIV0425]|uniref:Uncharacterized protein n=1 Tax=Candidatus Enterococcus wittei TaxID=1987383 RepID=A0A2C9XQX1_9ENTE|nr:hypothetical protein [Enterococcus sp. 10A9_DIV0425]OTP12258.1 hypothetical protein A5844_000490 [Enterococcus sp. 10A9_DIV0425]THE13231.1 hypothetical protein E1H99_06430 [Enterococcus hirae]
MRRQTRKKINRLIFAGMICSSSMVIFSIILLFQKKYFWSFISISGGIIGLISFFSVRKEMKLVKEIKD